MLYAAIYASVLVLLAVCSDLYFILQHCYCKKSNDEDQEPSRKWFCAREVATTVNVFSIIFSVLQIVLMQFLIAHLGYLIQLGDWSTLKDIVETQEQVYLLNAWIAVSIVGTIWAMIVLILACSEAKRLCKHRYVAEYKYRHNLWANLHPIAYQKTVFKNRDTCAICLEEFQQFVKVVPLHCNFTHIFHVDCAKNWLKL